MWKETPTGVEFYFQHDKENISFEKWTLHFESYEVKAQWWFLKELIDNGQADTADYFVFVPNETLFELSAIDLRLLDMPDFYPFDIKILSRGGLEQSDFNYQVTFCDFNGDPIFARKIGCVLRLTSNRAYLLTKEQVALLNAIESFNHLPKEKKLYTENLLRFSEIKGLARETGALLDGYLNTTDVVSPRKIHLRLSTSRDTLEIIPEIKELDDRGNDIFQKSFDFHPQIESVYTIQRTDGSRTRVVFNGDQQDALYEIKKRRRISQEEALRIAECPQEFFNPEVVELDPTPDNPSFSDRVKEIGFYKPRVYPFISPYKSKWIPGLIIEDTKHQQRQMTIKSTDDLEKIKRLIAEAQADNKSTIEWEGSRFDINSIEPHIPFFEQQIDKPVRHFEKKISSGEPVLIIEENIDDVTYTTLIPRVSVNDFRHRYENPPNLKNETKIYPHQQEGIAWLQELYRRELPGGLLADDMGLGKTLQVLCFLNWHDKYIRSKEKRKKPYLIIAPLTLLENWESEYRKHFILDTNRIVTLYGDCLGDYKLPAGSLGHISIPPIHGSEKISRVREKRGILDVKKLSSSELVLTTYETVRDFQVDLGQIDWAVVVVDEAQKIKTPGTLVTNAIKALKTDFRIACTGTPVENSLVDLWCITDFAVPGYLGSARDFAKEFQAPLKFQTTNINEIGEKVRERIGIYIKRRLKEDILEGLPPKHLHIEDCKRPMPEAQLQRYMEELKALRKIDVSSVSIRKSTVLQIINALRDISDHPYLTRLESIELSLDGFINQSAKLVTTVEILNGIRNKGEKAIIFADRRNTCKMLHQVMCKKFGLDESDVYIVNGDMPGFVKREGVIKISRQSAIDKFESKAGFNVIIMSPLAAGVGLNITKANHVIHYSRWWNPAKEDQATDRVYRIGQTLPVHIYFPIATNDGFKTFDVVLHELLERKRTLMHGTLFPTEQVEVTPEEVFENIVGSIPDFDISEGIPIRMSEINSIEPCVFEAIIAAIFQSLGKKVFLTPEQNDKGVDIVVMPNSNENMGLLIQAKHTSTGRKVGSDAIREVFLAKGFYEKRLGTRFDCAAVTNTEFTSEATELASTNNVKLMDRRWLETNLQKTKIYHFQVRQLLFQRMDRL